MAGTGVSGRFSSVQGGVVWNPSGQQFLFRALGQRLGSYRHTRAQRPATSYHRFGA